MKKFLLTILLLCLFFALAGSIQAVTTIVKDYPELPGATRPGQAAPGEALPRLIQYIFVFSLSIVGVIGLAAIIIGAFGYLTAVGNPQKAADAKDKIFSALLGIILLLGSFLLLRTINPDLLKLGVKVPKVTVDVSSNGNGAIQGCRYVTANIQPTEIEAGESVTLTLERIDCTEEESQNHMIYYTVKQVVPASPSTGLGTDLLCKKIVDAAWEKIVKNTDTEFAQEFTFDKKCTEWGIPCKNLTFLANPICNMQKEAAELFYVTGEIEVPGQPTFFIPKVHITVIDGK